MSAAKRAGTAWEARVAAHLRDAGWPYAERRALAGTRDRGDVAGIPGIVLEAKAARQWEVAAWLKELAAEKANDAAKHAAVVVKRRGQPAGKAAVLLELDDYLALLKEAGW